jgi:hypothetical protein
MVVESTIFYFPLQRSMAVSPCACSNLGAPWHSDLKLSSSFVLGWYRFHCHKIEVIQRVIIVGSQNRSHTLVGL